MTNPRKVSKVHAFFTMGLCAFLFVGVNVQADTLLNYDFATATTGSATAPSLTISAPIIGISGAPMSIGVTTSTGNTSGNTSSPAYTWNRTFAIYADAAGAMAVGNYWAWSVTIAQGYSASINSLSGLQLQRTTTTAGPTSAELWISTDGTNYSKTGDTFTITGTPTDAATVFDNTFNITPLVLDAKSASVTLYFRLVMIGGNGSRAGIITSNSSDFAINGTVTGGSAKNLTWGGSSGVWDTAANNLAWKNSNNVSTAFAANDNATVNGGTLTVTNIGITSGSVAVGGTADTSISGGSVIGTTLTKTGSGVLTLLSSNAFSGGVTATFGTLKVGDSGALGTQGLTLDGTTLLVTNPAVVQLPSAIGVGTNAVTMNFGSGVDLTLNTVATIGTTNGAGIAKGDPSTFNKLYKTGAGALTFIGAVGSQMTYSGGVTKSGGLQLNIDAGSVSFNGAKTSTTMNLASGVVTDTYDTNTPPIQLTTYNGMVWNGNFYLKQGIVQINGGNIRGTGRIYVTNTGGTFAQRLDFNVPDIDNNVDVAAGSTLTLSAASGGAIKFNGLLTGSGIVANTGSGGAVLGNTNPSSFTGIFNVAQTSASSSGGMTLKAQTLASSAGVTFLAGQLGLPKLKIENSSTSSGAIIACPITGPGELTKAYDGDVILTGENSFSGGLVIQDAGTVYVTNTNSLGVGPLVAGSVDSRIGLAATATTNEITITNDVNTWTPVVKTNYGTVTNVDNSVTTNSTNVTTTLYMMAFAPGTNSDGTSRSIQLNSLVTNAGILKLSGGGNLYVNNQSNSYTGGTEIGTGSLIITNPLVLSTGPINFGTTTNSYLRFSSANMTLTNRMTVSGVTTNSTNVTKYTANFEVDAGLTASLTGGIASKGGVGTDQKYGARLEKWGTGSLVLAASNDITESFAVNKGTVTLQANNALSPATAVNMSGGKVLLAYSGDCSTGDLYVNSNSVLDLGLVNSGKSLHFTSLASEYSNSSPAILTVTNTPNGRVYFPADTTTARLAQIKSAENPTYIASVNAQGLLIFTAPIVAPSGLSYSTSNISGTVGTVITSVTPAVTGIVSSYAIDPALSAGLLFNTTTGEISGTPLAVSASAIYTVTATNAGGFISTPVTISITQAAPSGLSYSTSNISGTVGTVITSVTPAVTGTVSSYAIDPALPAGLLFNTTTGEISGTPSVTAISAIYTVTATNSGGFTTTTVTLVVVPSYSGSYGSASGTEVGVDGMPNLLRYAMGANSASASIVKPVSSLDTTKLTITAIVRINDPKVTIVGESSTDLSTWNTASPIVGVPTADQAGVTPGETQKQSFSVARGSNKTFLRLKAIRQN